jgi:hypothetical protein
MERECNLCIEIFKINEPMGNLKTLEDIMKTIEETYVFEEEYVLIKAEILAKANEWKEATSAFNRLKESSKEKK